MSTARTGRARPGVPRGPDPVSSDRRTCRRGRRAPAGAARARRRARPRAVRAAPCAASAAASSLGESSASTTIGTVGAPSTPSASRSAAPSAARSRGTRLRPRQAPASDARSSVRLRPVASGPVCLVVRSGVERVQPDGTAGTQRHRPDTPGIGQVGVFALGVDDPGPAAEDGLSPQERLDEGALAPPDLSEHDHVRIAHHSRGVELERVEDERATEQVVTDDDAPLAQARLGDEGVRRPEVPRGHLVGRDAWLTLSHGGERSPPDRVSWSLASPRSGNVQGYPLPTTPECRRGKLVGSKYLDLAN